MPNGDDKNLVRLTLTLEAYHDQFSQWPTELLVSSSISAMRGAIRSSRVRRINESSSRQQKTGPSPRRWPPRISPTTRNTVTMKPSCRSQDLRCWCGAPLPHEEAVSGPHESLRANLTGGCSRPIGRYAATGRGCSLELSAQVGANRRGAAIAIATSAPLIRIAPAPYVCGRVAPMRLASARSG